MKYKRVVYKIEVLVPENDDHDVCLPDLSYQVEEGYWTGKLSIEKVEVVNGEQGRKEKLGNLVRDVLDLCCQWNCAAKFVLSSGKVQCPECLAERDEKHKEGCAFYQEFSRLQYEVSENLQPESVRNFLAVCTFQGRLGQFRNSRHGRVDCPECHFPVHHDDDCKFGAALAALDNFLKE